jgi:hypothetical protein
MNEQTKKTGRTYFIRPFCECSNKKRFPFFDDETFNDFFELDRRCTFAANAMTNRLLFNQPVPMA